MNAKPTLAGSTIDTARRILASRFTAAGIDNAELDARLLLGEATRLDLTRMVVNGTRALTLDEADRIESFEARRVSGEPIARILGEQEFWELKLSLSPATLIPRADTETVVEVALKLLQEMNADRARIADLGTGSGAILLALLVELPHATGIGTDCSEQALQSARSNAARHGLSSRADFISSNFGAALDGTFDLIASNPPYIRSADIPDLAVEVREHDPHLALDGGMDGLDAYRIIASQAIGLLKPGGALVVEIGAGQAGDVEQIMAAAGLVSAGPAQADLAGILRCVAGRKPSF